jgi:hypothetical protein
MSLIFSIKKLKIGHRGGLEIGWNISLYLSLTIKSYQQVGRY